MLITNCSGRAKTKQSANDNTTFLLTYNDLMYFFFNSSHWLIIHLPGRFLFIRSWICVFIWSPFKHRKLPLYVITAGWCCVPVSLPRDWHLINALDSAHSSRSHRLIPWHHSSQCWWGFPPYIEGAPASR